MAEAQARLDIKKIKKCIAGLLRNKHSRFTASSSPIVCTYMMMPGIIRTRVISWEWGVCAIYSWRTTYTDNIFLPGIYASYALAISLRRTRPNWCPSSTYRPALPQVTHTMHAPSQRIDCVSTHTKNCPNLRCGLGGIAKPPTPRQLQRIQAEQLEQQQRLFQLCMHGHQQVCGHTRHAQA